MAFRLLAFGGLIGAGIPALGEGVHWFSEDVESFDKNADHRWEWDAGAVTSDGDYIVVNSEMSSSENSALRYNPSAAPSGTISVSITNEAAFMAFSDATIPEEDSIVTITLMRTNAADKARFAILDRSGASAQWQLSEVSGETGQCYQVVADFSYETGNRSVTMRVRRSDQPTGAWENVGLVKLADAAEMISGLVYTGYGWLKKLEAQTSVESFDEYSRWASAKAIMTWTGSASDMTSTTTAKFTTFTNGSDGAVYYGGKQYAAFPGYSGTAIEFYHGFQAGTAAYSTPGMAMRFREGDYERALNATFSPLALGGIIVESAATNYSLRASGGEVWLGDANGVASTAIRAREDFKLTANKTVFYSPLTIEVATNKTFEIAGEATLDAVNNSRLTLVGEGTFKVTKLMATGLVTLDYSSMSEAREAAGMALVDGSIELDSLTTLRLPAWVNGTDGITLCSGEIIAPAASIAMTIVVGGVSQVVDATFAGGKLTFGGHDYSAWANNPAMFTWVGTTTAFASGKFRQFDIENNRDGELVFEGSTLYENVPSQIGSVVNPFVRIFNESSTGGAYRNPGYALRFAAGNGIAGEIDVGEDPFELGGLLVEVGMTGCSLTGGEMVSGLSTRFGDSSGQNENRLEFNEDFLLNRTGAVSFVGASVVSVASNKVFEIRGADVTIGTNVANGALIFAGEGAFKVEKLVAKGSVKLDYSQLMTNAVLVRGELEIDDNTSFALPATLAAGQDFALCSGAISGAVDGDRWVRFGDKLIYVTLTFNAAAGKVRYAKSTAAVNSATLSGDVDWAAIKWDDDSMPKPGLSDVFTLTADVTITLNDDMGKVPMLIVDGHRLTIRVGKNSPTGIEAIQVTGGGEVYFELLPNSAGWGEALTVPKANCTIVINGGSGTFSSPSEWAGAIAVNGSLVTRGYVKLSSTGNSLGAGGSMVVENGLLQLSGGEDSMAGSLSIASGAMLTSLADNLLAASESPVIEVRGTLDLGDTCWTIPAGATIRHYGGGVIKGNGVGDDGVALMLGTASHPFTGYSVLAGENAAVSNAELAAVISLQAESAISIAKGTRLQLTKAGPINGTTHEIMLSGEGGLETLPTTQLFVDSSVACGAIEGAGLVKFGVEDPTAAYGGGMFTNACWRGTVWFVGTDLGSFDPRVFGNQNSKICMSECTCNFRNETTIEFPSPLELVATSEKKAALNVRQGFANAEVCIDQLSGDGELQFACPASSSAGYALSILNGDNYEGSITVSQGAIVLAKDESFTIASNATWTVEKGRIELEDTTALNNRGLIAGQVAGCGTVYYRGTVGEDKIEEAAGYENGVWTGSVVVADATLKETRLQHVANANSRFVFNGAVGTLASQVVTNTICFEGEGLTVTGNKVVTFDKINGDGPINMTAGKNSAAFYRVLDVSDYEGRLSTSNGAPGFVVGKTATMVDNVMTGRIELVEGATMRVPPDNAHVWRARSFGFGENLNVIGNAGAALFDVITLDDQTDYGALKIHSLMAEDSRLIYRLLPENYGEGTYLFLDEAPTPPEVAVESLKVAYGADMSTAKLVLTVTNFWAGAGYEGKISATVLVRDATGRIVAVVGNYIDPSTSSVFELGTVKLPIPTGGNYTYELKIGAAESDFTDPETIVDMVDCEPFAHEVSGNWFEESIESNKSVVDHTPDRPSNEDIVKVEFSFDLTNATKEAVVFALDTAVDVTNAAIVVYRDATSNVCARVYDPAASALVSAAPSFGEFGYAGGSNIILRITMNYLAGTICYQLGSSSVLTNGEGRSLFAMTDSMKAKRSVESVSAVGSAFYHYLVGVEETPMLAQASGGTATNRFASLDAALEYAATNDLEDIGLLWDVTWRPSLIETNRTYRFAKNGYEVTIDAAATNALAAAGYQIVINEDGSYKVSEIGYELSFDVNWLTPSEIKQGVMPNRQFTVVNDVVTNVANAFVVEGRDFDYWNDQPDGSGEFSFTNHADIAMSTMGLKDTTLYAQWKLQQRDVIIEAADEFVYVESVTTNGVNFEGVAYQQTDAIRGLGRVKIPVNYGCDELVVRFSTDIGKQLTFDERDFASNTVIKSNVTIENTGDKLPHVVGTPGYAAAFSPVQAWAASKGLDVVSASSAKYATASSKLDLYSLLDEDTEVVITDLKISGSTCRFHVTIDGEPVRDSADIAGMVLVSGDLSNWQPATEVTVSEGGLIEANTGDDNQFIKIVIKPNE